MVFNLFPRSPWLRGKQELAAQNPSEAGSPRIFLTGVTGFVGGAIAANLAGSASFKEMLFLVRAQSAAEGVRRVRASIARFTRSAAPPAVSERQIILADLKDPQAFSDARLNDVTHVIHSAAVTSFADRPDIWEVNVNATLRLAARFSGHTRLRRFVYVGTAMACGVARGPVVTESMRLPEERAHLVPYTASKAQAENQLRERFPELPLVSVRPSIIIGHSALGCKPSASIFWILKLVSQLNRFVCPPTAHLDIVPVDYCAQTIVALTLKETLGFSAYHIAAGLNGSAMVEELLQAFHSMDGTAAGQPYERVSEEALLPLARSYSSRYAAENRVAKEPGSGLLNIRMLHKALMLYGRFSKLNYIFDTQRLLSEGLAPAPSFLDYIGRCDRSTRKLSLKAQMAYDFK
ncbi:Nucleoside-diphosphate-sugar epimerase [Collimonas arenae]|uniref:Nucleoside-diphosphate-sugar epimerase n=1 Tax=Collimonas arenae TaxID=279058 RepID=A0A0A1FF06_9BURK|nr:SDR family oxidoreductase [Collimonas arenae]AIY43328.1 Nucleoside-diphosphate-sugar epimerase [Collimonas arenae]